MFLFAPAFHPAMKELGTVRRELGIRTIFNALGPLANPAGATRQLIGVGRPELAPLLADALAALGSERAIVFHSENGLDELMPGRRRRRGRGRRRLDAPLAARRRTPSARRRSEVEALSGGDADGECGDARAPARGRGRDRGARRCSLNVAVALVVEGRARGHRRRATSARAAAIDSGGGRGRSFERLQGRPRARMSDVLERILADKRARLARGEYAPSRSAAAAARPTAPRFVASLRQPGTRIIAEIKARSPSAGEILPGADGKVETFALLYRRGHAAAISVVVEEDHFGGDPTGCRGPRAFRACPS